MAATTTQEGVMKRGTIQPPLTSADV